MDKLTVTSPDGVKLAAYTCGNPAGPGILFIHGFNQCYLSWLRQLEDAALRREFHMAAFDLRGHGSSGKPEQPDYYGDDQRWADDVAAIIAATGLRRPVLVNWSYAGRVVTDYVRCHGTSGIAGINFVAAYTKNDPAFEGPSFKHIPETLSDDLAVSIAATRAFARACFEIQPTPEEFETILAYNMINPPRIRAAVRARTHNPGDLLPTLSVPVLVTHGTHDRLSLVARAHWTASQVPGATLSIYDGVGHSPFWEDAPRFNRELAEFVRAANA